MNSSQPRTLGQKGQTTTFKTRRRGSSGRLAADVGQVQKDRVSDAMETWVRNVVHFLELC